MGTFIVYILKSACCLAIFYLFHRVLLSKETFHRFNRFALLALMLIASALPLVQIHTEHPVEMQQTWVEVEDWLQDTSMLPQTVAVEEESPIGWAHVLMLVYLLGMVGCAGWHFVSYLRLAMLVRKSRRESLSAYLPEEEGSGIRLLVHEEEGQSPFSWMNLMVVSRKDLLENGRQIAVHEWSHIHHRHSWDLLLADLCILLQWFNPAAWLLKQELQAIHEYEADETVLKRGVNAKEYQTLLIKKAVGTRLYSMANNLNHSSLKKRITMMIKKKSNPWARLKYLYVLPLAAVAVAAFARPEVSNQFDEISSVKVNDFTSIVKEDEVKNVQNSSDEKFTLSGKVMEYSSKKPVPAASVIVKGTTNGTLADLDGNFKIEVKKGDVLAVSYVGLQTQFVPVQSDANLVVWMKDDVQNLEEMVVVAYAPAEEEAPAKEEASKEAPQEEVVFMVVEEMPQYPGGMAECMKFLGKNIKYPVLAQEAKIQGRVIVQFVVGRDGSVSQFEVLRSVSPELDAEALRVLKLMPKWIPGKQRGKAVAVKYTLPITFRLQQPEPKQEVADAPYLHINLKVDKDADTDIVDVVKEGLRTRFKGGTDVRDNKPVLVVVDGKVVGVGSKLLSEVPVQDIQSIEVIKNEAAVAEYGDQAKEGAILISTKKKQ